MEKVDSATDLVSGALNLTMFGMGFVFLFLTLLVFVTKLMPLFIRKKQLEKSHTVGAMKEELDEETKFVIEQAIKMHRGA